MYYRRTRDEGVPRRHAVILTDRSRRVMSVLAFNHHRRHRPHLVFAPFLFLGPLPLIAFGVAGLVGVSMVFALAMLLVGVVFSAAIAAAVLGAMGFVAWQLARFVVPRLAGVETHPRRMRGGAAHATQRRVAVETPVDALRRRYAAGEIGQAAFRRGLVDLLKERYVRGDLTLDEFESRVRHVYQDPALGSPIA
jgi:uncharacterized membrane protein